MSTREIVVRRWFRHAPDRVWRAWTDPERLARWFGPDGFATVTERFDFRPGGDWVFALIHPEHGHFDNHVHFLTVEAPRRLVYEHSGNVSFRVEVHFEPTAGGTQLTMQSTFPDEASCQLVVEQFGAVEGGRQTLSRLEELLGRESRVRVAGFSLSLEGYGAGPNQSLEHPLGLGGQGLHDWMRTTRTWQQMTGGSGGTIGPDDDFAARSFLNVGAWVLGRNMFGPVRGPWPDGSWRGWWGEEPPYHCPVFVLTHHERDPLEMAGGTTFHFVTDGPQAALDRARQAAGSEDVRIGGGAATIRQYLAARAIDELHLVFSDALLGSGESLLHGIDLPAQGYSVAERVHTALARHVVLRR